MNDKSYVVIKDRIEREELILFLKNSYDKFGSWKKNAIENNITSYEKEIDRLRKITDGFLIKAKEVILEKK